MKAKTEDYTRVILPTQDTLLCRGTNIFASPSKRQRDDQKVLVVIPRSYVDIISRRAYSDVPGYSPDLDELFSKNGRDFLRFTVSHGLTYEGLVTLETGVDVCFMDCRDTDICRIVKETEDELRKTSGKKTVDARKKSILNIQATLDESRAILQLNGYSHASPRYGDLEPDISDRFMVEVNNMTDPELFGKLEDIIVTVELPDEIHPQEEEYEYEKGASPTVKKVRHIPLDAYASVMKKPSEPNQFLVMTEFVGSGDEIREKVSAFCHNYRTRQLEEIDFNNIRRIISPVWEPRSDFHVRQLCALYALLNDDIKIVYLVGGKQTGKTSIAMAAAEARQFGKKMAKLGQKRKETVEEHITLIKSGLPRDIWREQDLLAAYASFKRAFSEQKLGGHPFEEMLKPRLERKTEKVATKGDPRNIDNILALPDIAPFVLLHPNEEQGMSFTGCTIRDECQNEYPHKMKEFLMRRGPGAKMVILGDLYGQVTRPGLDTYWNGLLLSIFKNIGKPHVAGVKLTECWAAR